MLFRVSFYLSVSWAENVNEGTKKKKDLVDLQAQNEITLYWSGWISNRPAYIVHRIYTTCTTQKTKIHPIDKNGHFFCIFFCLCFLFRSLCLRRICLLNSNGNDNALSKKKRRKMPCEYVYTNTIIISKCHSRWHCRYIHIRCWNGFFFRSPCIFLFLLFALRSENTENNKMIKQNCMKNANYLHSEFILNETVNQMPIYRIDFHIFCEL